MHLVSLSKEISLFLNNLNDYLLLLLPDIPVKIFNNPEILNDINSIILFGNKSLYIDKWFYMFLEKFLKINRLNISSKSYILNDEKTLIYKSSNYHFEFLYSDKYIKFIKGIVKNESISGDQNIFYIKDIHKSPKSTQIPLIKLIDTYFNTKFIITSTNLSLIDNTLKSRCLCINLSFHPEKIFKCFNNISPLTYEDFYIKYEKHYDDILEILINNNSLKLYEQCLINLLSMLENEKNKYYIINNIRHFCNKVFHLNISFVTISKFIINYYKQHKFIHQIVNIFATNESMLKKSNKELLIYEKAFLELYSILEKHKNHNIID